MNRKEIRVMAATCRVASHPYLLKIFGMGSCVALALQEQDHGLGGLAHILLPGPAPAKEKNPQPPGNYKYADQAVKALVEEMQKQGASMKKLRAAVIGGANMFTTPDIEEKDMPGKPGIGKRNVDAVKRMLELYEIPLFGEDVGGNNGRTIVFDPASGKIQVSNYKGDLKILAPQQNGPGDRIAAE